MKYNKLPSLLGAGLSGFLVKLLVLGLLLGCAGLVRAAQYYYVDWTSADVAAGTASGIITLPDGSTVKVDFKAIFADGSPGNLTFAQTDGGTNFWIPSEPYISSQVSNAPPDSDILALTGGENQIYVVTLSAAIKDPIMAIISLGAPGTNTTYDFDSPFTIVSQGAGWWGGGPDALDQLPGDILRGNEGHGTIQFIGTFSTFSWVVPDPEGWHGFTFGIRTTEALEPTFDLKVAHRLPASGYDVNPASIQPTADAVTASRIDWQSATTDTARFELTGQTPNLAPGESRAISTGTDIIATYTDRNGQVVTVTLPLPPVVIASAHILTLDPPSRTVVAGQSVGYNVILANPTGTDQTYTLGLIGLEDLNATLAGSITVPAGQTVTTPLTVGPPASTPTTTRAFAVTATTATGGVSTAPGELRVTNTGTGTGTPPPTITLPGQAVDITLIPTVATAGLGTAATFTARVTNLGDETTTFNLAGAFPAGFSAALGETRVTLLPGLSNYRDVRLTLTPPTGTNPGDYPLTVAATAAGAPTVTDQAAGTVQVVNLGVDVDLTPDAASPPATLSLKVTNTGRARETYDLALAGPVALYATLAQKEVTLDPGASLNVAVSITAINTSLPGTLSLTAVATSRANPAVRDTATAQVTIPATRGVTAVFNPPSVTLDAVPGSAKSLLLVQNTGNTEDAFSAAITGTSGLVTGKLQGLDGQPTEQIPLFRLPALATGAITLDANLPDSATGSVTTEVKSTDQAQSASATFTLSTGNQAPNADAGTDQTVFLGQTITLDGSKSSDPDSNPQPLTYQWHFVTPLPTGSTLTDDDITGATADKATFEPDVVGQYLVELTVSDGAASDTDRVVIDVSPNLPVADAGPDQNAKTGKPVILDGSGSYDPAGQLIAFQWSFETKPATSKLTEAALNEAQTPTPAFTPDVAGAYKLRLIVRSGSLVSQPDFVTITAYSGNVPPNARAGLDQTVYTSSPVNLDGSASFDPDAGPSALTYLWTLASQPPTSSAAIVDASQPKASFTPDVAGSYELNLRVFDGKDSNDDQVTITASLPNVAPNAVAGPDQNVAFSKEVTLNGTASNDPDSGPNALAHAWRFVYLPAGSALSNASLAEADKAIARFTPDKAGSYVVQLAVNDGDASDFDNVLIKVTTPLTIKSVTASPNTLWPPNHKMVPVKVTVSATSPGNPTPVCQIRSVASSEPVDGTGDGDTAPDWQITGALTVNLRAERAGDNNARVYTITVQCTDKAGNKATKDVTVTVSHDQRK